MLPSIWLEWTSDWLPKGPNGTEPNIYLFLLPKDTTQPMLQSLATMTDYSFEL